MLEKNFLTFRHGLKKEAGKTFSLEFLMLNGALQRVTISIKYNAKIS